MADDLRAPRLHVSVSLAVGATAAAAPEQANYLANVLRLGAGARVLAFNGRDGEFLAEIAAVGRKGLALVPTRRTQPPEAAPDVDLLFAPLKHARLDYLAQKAVEMGAGRLRPVMTRRTQVARLNVERLGLADPVRHFEAHGLGLSDGVPFGAAPGSHVRLNFGCPRSTLAEGLARLKAGVGAL